MASLATDDKGNENVTTTEATTTDTPASTTTTTTTNTTNKKTVMTLFSQHDILNIYIKILLIS